MNLDLELENAKSRHRKTVSQRLRHCSPHLRLVQLFRFTNSIPRQPAMYGPSIVVIVEGEKAARFAGVDL